MVIFSLKMKNVQFKMFNESIFYNSNQALASNFYNSAIIGSSFPEHRNNFSELCASFFEYVL